MKKRLLALILCLVLCAALTVPALADDPVYVTSESCADVSCTLDGSNRPTGYTVKFKSGGSTTLGASGQYVLLVVKKPASGAARVVSENTIMYIDQYTGAQLTGENGVTFMPRSIPDCEILLGGDFAGSPIKLGEIVGQGVSVSGKVSFLGTTPATVTIYDENKQAIGSPVTTDSSGLFTISSVPDGKHYLVAERPGYVGSPIVITVNGENYTNANITLRAGDVNQSGSVEGQDLILLLNDFGKVKADGYSRPAMDLNDSGGIEGQDLVALLNQFGQSNISLANFQG